MPVKYASRCLVSLCLLWLCAVAALSHPACAQTTITEFPKYIVLGVVYAPPGSASNVSYGNSSLVGATDAITYSLTGSETATTSTTVGGGLFGLGASTTTTDTDGWSTTNGGGNTVTVQTTQGNTIATMGPISSSLGVDHDNDVIYILLNPAVVDSITFNATTGALSTIVWNGLQSNGCDLTDSSVSPTFYQQLSGCDPNQFPYPDIIGLPVWCLKNPYSPNQGCAQWIQYTSRSWDKSYRGQQFPTSSPGAAYPESPSNPPGLTLQDFSDILQADPFVAINGNAVNVCHPAYGSDLDPNDPETIPASYPFTPTGSEVNYVGRTPGSCGQPVVSNVKQPFTMNRFQPYGTVEYPVPGPNGLPSTYSGQFEYSATNQTTTTTADSHTSGTSTDITAGFNNSFGYWNITVANFNASISSGSSNSTTWQNQNSTQSTQTQNSTASYSITGPQLSDNYAGPATYSVYLDNIYHTYAFYSPLETKPVLGTIAISPGANSPNPTNLAISTLPSSTVVTSTSPSLSTPQAITITNNSSYPLTMAGPAVTFSDPGFVIAGTWNGQSYPDNCSNQQLLAYGYSSQNGQNYYCTLWIQFAPQYSDAPNPVTLQNEICTSATACSNGVQATMVAAGTENVNSYENILVTSPISVQGTVTSITQGATLLPTGVSQSSLQNTNPLPYIYNFGTISTASQTEVFLFTNNYSSPVEITALSSSNSIFTASPGSSNGCPVGGSQVAAGASCTINVVFTPAVAVPSFEGAISVTGSVVTGTIPGWNNGAAFQLANAGVLGSQNVAAITPGNLYPSYEFFEGSSCSDYGGTCGTLTGGSPGSISVTNNTSSTVSVVASGTAGIAFGVDTCSLSSNQSCTILFGPTYGSAPSCSPGTAGSVSQCTASITGVITVTAGSSSAQFNVSETVNYVSYNAPPTGVVVAIGIHGKERSKTGDVLAKPATGTLTLRAVSPSSKGYVAASQPESHETADDSSQGRPIRVLPIGQTSEKSTLSVNLGGFTKSISIPPSTSINDAAAMLAAQLNAAGSPVKAVANGPVITLTSIAKGKESNLPLSAFVAGAYQVTASGGSLMGGQSAGDFTTYDRGSVRYTTNGVTAIAEWGSTSTPESIATDLAASINHVAGAYWMAKASGSVVDLTPAPGTTNPEAASRGDIAITRRAPIEPTSHDGVSVVDSAGFSPPSFTATMKN
jgi:hypothetical protein